METQIIVKDGKRVHTEDEAKRRRKFQRMMREAGYVRLEDMAPACVYQHKQITERIIDIDEYLGERKMATWAYWLEKGETPPPF